MKNNDFPTLDHLLGLSIGMEMSQQMTEMMNKTMQEMKIPESAMPIPNMQTEWYVAIEEKATGPYNENEIKKLFLSNSINMDSLVWCKGMPNWGKAKDVPKFFRIISQLPPSL